MSLSRRAAELKQKPSAIVKGLEQYATDPYNKDNPEGYLNFGIAENSLMDDLLLKKINQIHSIDSHHIHYSGMNVPDLKQNFTKFADHYLNISDLNPENVVVQSGVSAVCEALSFCLFDKGDVIMLATPYYNGFEHDFTKRFQCEFLKVEMNPKNQFKHEINFFIKAYDQYPHPEKIKGVLICHPHNPTGEILSHDFMQNIIDFAKERSLELISDEIYALSTHWGEEHQSLYQLAINNDIVPHLLYGMAKDFAIAGFKTGFYYSENKEVVEAMQSLQYFYPVSSLTQQVVSNILSDETFLNNYLPLNQERLNKSKRDITSSLSHFDFIEAGAGLFITLDLSHWCENFQDEENLHLQILNELKINVTRGKDLGLETPGFFRICFARCENEIREFCKRMLNLKRLNI